VTYGTGPWQTPNFGVLHTRWGSLRLAPITDR